jgi:hypothetical protein
MSLQSWEEHRENHEALLREIEERECQAAPSSQTSWDRLIEWLAARAPRVQFCDPAREQRSRNVRVAAVAWLLFIALVVTTAWEWGTQ